MKKLPCTRVTRFVWVDLEMSGLNVARDVILEVACIITDKHLNIIAQKPPLVIHHESSILENTDRWVYDQHSKSGLCDEVARSKLTCAQAEQELLAFVQQYCPKHEAPLCGNSVWMDRLFLRTYMPQFEGYLHYRIIDVSSVKLLVNCWFGSGDKEFFKKKNTHRALDDIQESIAELKFYREHFFKNRD